MQRPVPRSTPQRAANASIRSDLLDAAQVNLSATLEHALVEELKLVEHQKWRAQNREAIAAYNDYVEEIGVFSDGTRGF